MRALTLSALAAALLVGTSPAQDDVTKKELAKFQGTWKVINYEAADTTKPPAEILTETRFVFAGDRLYLLARGSLPVWVGSADDVIHDAASRARFRLALAAADRAFAVEAGADDLVRATTVWDLEGAEPVSGLSAA